MENDTALYLIKIIPAGRISVGQSEIEIKENLYLGNNSNENRWFILPSLETYTFVEGTTLGVRELHVEEYGSPGHVYLFKFDGDKTNFRAIQLAPHSHVEINGFPFFSRHNVSELSVEILIASELKIENKSICEWIEKEIPLSDNNTSVELVFGYKKNGKTIASKKVENLLELPVTMIRERVLHYVVK
ncbi:MAG: hypothetical protein ACJ77K_09590 [Bacteroidia bacterium]